MYLHIFQIHEEIITVFHAEGRRFTVQSKNGKGGKLAISYQLRLKYSIRDVVSKYLCTCIFHAKLGNKNQGDATVLYAFKILSN